MEFLLVLILFGIPLGVIPAMIAKSKGRDFAPWWIYGVFLFIIALVHALLLKPEIKLVEQQQAARGLKKCPFCAEMIKPDAKVCRYCSRDLPLPEQSAMAADVVEELPWDGSERDGRRICPACDAIVEHNLECPRCHHRVGDPSGG